MRSTNPLYSLTYLLTSSCIKRKQPAVRHRLLVSWHLQTISQDLFVFTVILEHRTTHY